MIPDLLLHPLPNIGGRQVVLLMTGTISWLCSDRLVDIGGRLRLDALRRIDHEQCALACGQTPA